MHQQMAATMDAVVDEIHEIQRAARDGGVTRAPALADDRAAHARRAGPGPKEVDGLPVEGTWRAHQVPFGRGPRRTPSTSPSSRRGCGATGPTSCSTPTARLVPELAELPPRSYRRMSANPHANGGLLLRDLALPDFRAYAVEVPAPGATTAEATRVLGTFLRDVIDRNRETFRIFGPDETASNRLGAVFEVTDRQFDGGDPAERRPPRARRPRHGGALRAPVPGLARGLPADRPPRPLQLLRGLHPHRRLDVQPAREVAEGDERHPLAATDRVAQLPAQLARLAPGPQRLQPPGPGLHRPRGQQEVRGHPGLPAARREHAAVGGRPLPAQPPLRERHRRRQAAGPELALDGAGDAPLHARDRHLGLGQQRPGRRARRRDGLLPATSRRSRRWRPSTCSASTCPT